MTRKLAAAIAAFALCAVTAQAASRIGIVSFKAPVGMEKDTASFLNELMLEGVMADGAEPVDGATVLAAVRTAKKSNPKASPTELLKQACKQEHLDGVLIASARPEGNTYHVVARLYSATMSVRATGKASSASLDGVGEAMEAAISQVFAGNATVSAGTSDPVPDARATSLGPPADAPVIQITKPVADGCRWEPATNGARLCYVVKDSELGRHLRAGDVVTQVDGIPYRQGLLTHARRKLLDGAAPQAVIRVARGHEVLHFVLERKPAERAE